MQKPMTKKTAKLAERARKIGIDVDWIEIRRTRAGRHQRSAGAWSWWACDRFGREVMGSQYSVSELLKAPRIEVTETYGVELHPVYETKEEAQDG